MGVTLEPKKLFSEGCSLWTRDLSISTWALPGGLSSEGPRDKCSTGLHAVKVAFSSALSVPASRLYRVAVRRSSSMSKTPIRAALWFPQSATHSGRTVRFRSFPSACRQRLFFLPSRQRRLRAAAQVLNPAENEGPAWRTLTGTGNQRRGRGRRWVRGKLSLQIFSHELLIPDWNYIWANYGCLAA